MRREIRFRAWDTIQKKMWYDGFDITPQGKIFHTYGIYSNVVGLQLEQYTGLQDRQGVEIYEGDVVLVPDWQEFGVDAYCAVRWDEDLPGWSIASTDNDSTPLQRAERFGEAGNIHQNPELVKEAV